MEARQTMSTTLRTGILIGVVILAAIAFLATTDLSGQELTIDQGVDTSGLEIAPVQGALAPDFELITLGGEPIQLSELRGQAVMINLWATWCGPCRIEMPHIQDRFERYEQDGFVVLAVDFDEPQDVVADFRDELGLTFSILLDPGAEVQKLYRNRSYPSSFFIDENGVIQSHHIGVMTEVQLDENLLTIGIGP
jgi:peroxiredoxin